MGEQECPYCVEVQLGMPGAGLQTFQKVPQQVSSAPAPRVDTAHEFVIDLDVADLADPVCPVVEVRLVQPFGGQSMLKEGP